MQWKNLLCHGCEEFFKPTQGQHSGHGYGLLTQCDEAWKESHRLFYKSGRRTMDTGAAWKPSLCYALGCCVCSGAGKDSHHFHSNLVSLLKPYLRVPPQSKASPQCGGAKPKTRAKAAKPEARTLLEKGFLVLRLQADVALHQDENSSDEAQEDFWMTLAATKAQQQDQVGDKGMKTEVPHSKDLWVHVGYVNFSSWHFSVLPLHGPVEDGHGKSVRISVPDPVSFELSVAFFANHIAFARAWKVSVYRFSTDRSLPLDDMAPGVLTLIELKAIPTMRFWRGSAFERAQEARQNRAKGARSSGRTPSSVPLPMSALPRIPGHSTRKTRVPLADAFAEEENEPVVENPLLSLLTEDASDFSNDSNAEADNVEAWVPEAEIEPADVPDFSVPAPSSNKMDAVAGSASSSKSPPPEEELKSIASDTHSKGEKTEPSKAPIVKVRTGTEKKNHVPELGELAYYPKLQSISAFCTVHSNDCRRSRTVRASDVKGWQGRPCGYLCAWLADALHHPDKESHKSSFYPTKAERLEGRRLFNMAPGAEAFAQHERPLRPGEALEPDEYHWTDCAASLSFACLKSGKATLRPTPLHLRNRSKHKNGASSWTESAQIAISCHLYPFKPKSKIMLRPASNIPLCSSPSSRIYIDFFRKDVYSLDDVKEFQKTYEDRSLAWQCCVS